MFNFTKLFKEAIQGFDQTDGEIRDDDVLLTQVKLTVQPGSCRWTEMSHSDNPSHPRKVNITKDSYAGPEAVGQVHTTNENQNFVRVTLDKGIARGLNRMLKLPLDERRPDLIEAFGPHVEIDPSKALSEPIQNKMKIGVAVEGPLDSRGATATIVNKEREYKGHFTCKVVAKGPGLACGMQQQIADAIQSLKTDPYRDNSDIVGLDFGTSKGKKVIVFTMEGDLECKWDFEHTVEWK